MRERERERERENFKELKRMSGMMIGWKERS